MTDRRILALSGADTRKFLQGIVTNDTGALDQGAVYTALLTPQGKFITDFFMIPDGDDVLVDVAAEPAEALLKRLTMYKLRANVTIEMTDRHVSRGLGETPAGAFRDPRHDALGWRAYDGREGDDNVDWDAIRVEHVIPEQGIELTPDSFILEYGFDRINGVNFKKGCYVGQEVTARMHHKTTLRKGLVQVEIDGAAPVGTPLLTEGGKDAGKLFTQSKGKALAYLRFDRAGGPLKAGNAIVTAHLD